MSDFGLRDLLTPSAKRLRKHMSAIVNFAKFREEKLSIQEANDSQREVLKAQLNKAQTRREALTQELSSLKQRTVEEARTIAQLESDCAQYESQIGMLNQSQAEIREISQVC